MTARTRKRVVAAITGAVVIFGAGWLFRDHLPWGKEKPATEVSEAAAVQAEAKLARMRENGDTARLTGVEITSLIRYRFEDRFAPGLATPSVVFAGDTVRVVGRFPTDRLPDVPELRSVRTYLPDTADVDVQGSLRTTTPGRAAMRMQNVRFAKFPVPENFYPKVLTRIGRRDEPGLARDEFPFPLPAGVGSARVEAGELVLAPAR